MTLSEFNTNVGTYLESQIDKNNLIKYVPEYVVTYILIQALIY